jgi:hypothetical protein
MLTSVTSLASLLIEHDGQHAVQPTPARAMMSAGAADGWR